MGNRLFLVFLLSFTLAGCSGFRLFPKKNQSADAEWRRGRAKRWRGEEAAKPEPKTAPRTAAPTAEAGAAKLATELAAEPAILPVLAPNPAVASDFATLEPGSQTTWAVPGTEEEKTELEETPEPQEPGEPLVFSKKAGGDSTDDRHILLLHDDHVEIRTIVFADTFLKRVKKLRYSQISKVALENNLSNSDLLIETDGGSKVSLNYLPAEDAQRAQKLIQERISSADKTIP